MYRKLLLIIIILFVAACGAPPPEESPAEGSQTEEAPLSEEELEPISLGVGFVPNVQFAPFYVAQAKGFYAEEGLDVSLEHGFENDFVALTAQGERQFAVASGDQVILAQAQGLPIVYVMKWYEDFPVGVMALSETGIETPEQLENHTVGIPGLFGASYVGWQALVYATDLDASTIELKELGFTQAEAVSQGQVDAAVVYITNEPILLSQNGEEVNLIQVSDYINLVANGIITNQTVLRENPELVGRMVRGTLKGLEYTLNNPDEAFEMARAAIPEMTDEDAPTQKLVLEASLDLWQSEQLGYSEPESWTESAEFMREVGLIDSAVSIGELYTNQFVEE